jgi:indolepyruvate ferredoxin oxidoreductase, beta subunit
MKKDIILAGVGGQGILSIAAIIGHAAVSSGLYLKQAEVHGMSQRGGDVQSNLRLSDKPIASDLIPHGKADMIISVEPMESLRYLPYLSQDGWVVTNTKPFINIPDYPEVDILMDEIKKLPHHVALDAEKIADELGTVKAANIVMLGAASPFLGMEYKKLQNAIQTIFARKGNEIVELNLKALEAGKDFAEKNMNNPARS